MPEYFAEPDPTTQEMTAAHARSYALSAPHPQGAAAAERPPQIPLAPVKRVQAQFNPLADGMIYLVVFLGGALGTAMRYALSLAMPEPLAATGFFSAFHTATFIANMAACFIFAGLTAYMAQASWIRKRVRQLTSRGVGMGMCGGFSTLSAMVIEELTSIHGDQIGGFLFYMFASFAVGMLVAALGAWLATDLASHRAARIASAAIDDRTRAAHRRAKGEPVVHVVDDTSSVFVDVTSSTPPSGDYGQPKPADGAIPSYEPAPITDEIPMVGNPSTGDADESKPGDGRAGGRDGLRAGGRDAGRDDRGIGGDGAEREFLYRDRRGESERWWRR